MPLVVEAPLVHVAESVEYDSVHAEQGQDSVCSPQAVASAPLWDEEVGAVIGMISASDFIHVLRRLRHRCHLNSVFYVASVHLYSLQESHQPTHLLSLPTEMACQRLVGGEYSTWKPCACAVSRLAATR